MQIHAEACLPEEDGPVRVPADQERDQQHRRRAKRKQRRGPEDVETALEKPGGPRDTARRETHERQTFKRVDADVRADCLEQPGHEVDVHVMLSNATHQVQHLLVPVTREGHDHAIHTFTTDDLADVFRGSQNG